MKIPHFLVSIVLLTFSYHKACVLRCSFDKLILTLIGVKHILSHARYTNESRAHPDDIAGNCKSHILHNHNPVNLQDSSYNNDQRVMYYIRHITLYELGR